MIKIVKESINNIKKEHLWIGIGHAFITFFLLYGTNQLVTGISYADGSTKYTSNTLPAYILIGVFVLIALYSIYGITIDLGPTMNEFIKTCSEFIDNYFKNNAILEMVKTFMK